MSEENNSSPSDKAAEGSLPAEGSALSAEGSALSAEGSALSAEGSALSAEGSALSAEGSALSAEGSALSAEGSALSAEGSALSAEGSALSAEGSALSAEGSLPAEGSALSAEGSALSAEGSGSASEKRRGVLVIISSPSGAGKTTLARRLLGEFEGQLEFSVSFTTRLMRVGEIDGRDYHFVTPDEFAAMVGRGEFAEYAEVHGNHYGTSRATVERALSDGIDVVFDIDWQGGESLSAQWPNDALMIFIVPPSLATLEARLRRRATDSADVIERRLRVALSELSHHREYAHVVVNDDLDEAYAKLRKIYEDRVGPENSQTSTSALSTTSLAAEASEIDDCGSDVVVASSDQMLDPAREHARRLVAELDENEAARPQTDD